MLGADQALEDLMKLVRASELSDKQASEIEHTETANAIRNYNADLGNQELKQKLLLSSVTRIQV